MRLLRRHGQRLAPEHPILAIANQVGKVIIVDNR